MFYGVKHGYFKKLKSLLDQIPTCMNLVWALVRTGNSFSLVLGLLIMHRYKNFALLKMHLISGVYLIFLFTSSSHPRLIELAKQSVLKVESVF